MLRSELIDRIINDAAFRDALGAMLDIAEPVIRTDEREKWRAELQSSLDLLSEGSA